jgi:CRISPR-associated protein Csm5
MTIRNRVYALTITTRSPLHIGTGRELVKDYDFLFDTSGRTAYVLDAEAVLLLAEQELQQRNTNLRKQVEEFDAKSARAQSEKEADHLRAEAQTLKRLRRNLFTGLTLDQFREARLLNVKRHLAARIEVEGMPVVRYALTGDLSQSDQVHEQMKNAYGQPYLPGSSLKGALRTILAWQHFPELGAAVNLDALIPERSNRPPMAKFAGGTYEDALFVVPPPDHRRMNAQNRDMLRMLQVSDSAPVAPESLILAPITVYGSAPPPGQGVPQGQPASGMDVLNVEAVDRDTTFQTHLHIERYPFESGEAEKRGLTFAPKQPWLEALAAACRERSQARINAELVYYTAKNLNPLVQFYTGLRDELASLGAQSFLLQLGWGAGWGSTTLDDRLQADAEGFAEIVRHYRLDRGKGRGRTFPATRKLVLNQGQPWWPLGWVRVDMEEVER